MIVSRVAAQVPRNLAVRNFSYANGSVICGPPTKNVSFREKVTMGLVMITSLLVPPCYILSHMEEYKKK